MMFVKVLFGRRAALTMVLAALVTAVAAGPAAATTYRFATNLLLQAGGSETFANTDLGPFTNVEYVNTQATSDAASCSQLYATPALNSLIDSVCGGVGDRVTSGPYNRQGVWCAAVHNHSTHQGRFNASYDY
jgi:hypothetical protein